MISPEKVVRTLSTATQERFVNDDKAIKEDDDEEIKEEADEGDLSHLNKVR